jgi:hypothetical protein
VYGDPETPEELGGHPCDLRGPRWQGEQSNFLLGDFAMLTRFCALSQATDMVHRRPDPMLLSQLRLVAHPQPSQSP